MRWVRAAVGTSAVAIAAGIFSTCPNLVPGAAAHDSCQVGTVTVDNEMRARLQTLTPQVNSWSLWNGCDHGGLRQLIGSVETEVVPDVVRSLTHRCGLPRQFGDPWTTDQLFVCARNDGQFVVRVTSDPSGSRITAQAF